MMTQTLTDHEALPKVDDAPEPRTARRAVGWILTAPYVVTIAILAVFFAWPLLEVVLRSLHPDGVADYGSVTFSLDNYTQVFTRPFLRTLLVQTAVVSGVATVVTMALAFPVAYLMSRVRPAVAALITGFIVLEFFSSIVVRLFGVSAVLGSQGPVNQLLEAVGFGRQELIYNTFATTVGMAQYLVPIAVLVLYSAMLTVDQNILLAARTLGASAATTFWKVYFPQIRSSIIATSALCFILAAGFFLTPAMLGGTGDITIPLYIVQQVGIYEWGTASSMGVVLLTVTVVGYYISVRFGKGSVFALGGENVGKGTAAAIPFRLGPTSILLWAVTILVVIALLSPLVVVVASSFNGSPFLNFPPTDLTTSWYSEAFSDPVWTAAIWKSVRVSLAVGLLGCAMGLCLARLKSRTTNRHLADVIAIVAFLPLIVPAILTAVGVFGIEARIGLLGSDIGLILPQAVGTLPYAFVIIDGALARGTQVLESAAWTLGASRLQAFWRVVVPRILPAVVAAFALCAVIAWDEIMIALFQTGFEKTLPVLIYSTVQSGPTPAVSAVATVAMLFVILLLSSVLLVRMTLRARGRRANH